LAKEKKAALKKKQKAGDTVVEGKEFLMINDSDTYGFFPEE